MVLAEERNGTGRPLRVEDIAHRSRVPKAFLEHILWELRGEGLLVSVRGRNGGYRLAIDPHSILLRDVIVRMGWAIAPIPCLSDGSDPLCEGCDQEGPCRLQSGFQVIFSSYLTNMASMSLAGFMSTNSTR